MSEKLEFWDRQTLRDKPARMLVDYKGDIENLEKQLKEKEALLIEACEMIDLNINYEDNKQFYNNELSMVKFLGKPEIKKLRGEECQI
jgi:hypothetical protein